MAKISSSFTSIFFSPKNATQGKKKKKKPENPRKGETGIYPYKILGKKPVWRVPPPFLVNQTVWVFLAILSKKKKISLIEGHEKKWKFFKPTFPTFFKNWQYQPQDDRSFSK